MSAIERRLQELREIATKYAKAEAERTYLEDFKKSKLAMLMAAAECSGITAVNAQEREARANAEYVELLQGLKVAVEEAERLYWELQIARMGAGLWQTEQANMRSERRGYGT